MHAAEGVGIIVASAVPGLDEEGCCARGFLPSPEVGDTVLDVGVVAGRSEGEGGGYVHIGFCIDM